MHELPDKNHGFTLIELMISVAIVGILASLAVPGFMRYQSKAKQAEARTNLGTIFTSQMTYHADNLTYSNDIALLDWVIKGSNRYSYSTVGNLTTFSATAAGNIDNDGTIDTWTINQNKDVLNTINDLAS